MNTTATNPDPRVVRAVGRLLAAIDNALAAVREVEKARAMLDQEAQRLRRGLRVVPIPSDTEEARDDE